MLGFGQGHYHKYIKRLPNEIVNKWFDEYQLKYICWQNHIFTGTMSRSLSFGDCSNFENIQATSANLHEISNFETSSTSANGQKTNSKRHENKSQV